MDLTREGDTEGRGETYGGDTFKVSLKKREQQAISITQFESLLTNGRSKVVDQIGAAVSQVKENSVAILSNQSEIRKDLKDLKDARSNRNIRDVVQSVVRETLPPRDATRNLIPQYSTGATCSEQHEARIKNCLLYTSPSPRDRQKSRMPSSA